MSDSVQIRYATAADVTKLAPVFDQYRVWYGQESDVAGANSFLLQRLSDNESVVFMAIQDNCCIGFTQLYPLFSSVSMERVWVLNDLFVCKESRQCGIGQALLSTASEFAKELGALRLELATAHDNHTAQTLYEKLGWHKNTEFLHYTLNVN